jgi:uncharacterized protein with HEPN domain
MPRSVHEYLQHILDEAKYLMESSQGLRKEEFLKDATLQRAFVRSIEVIGEAAKQISDEWRKKHLEIEWRAITGMRDRLIHGYFGIDYEIVWDVVKNKVPELAEQIKRMPRNEAR